MRLQHTHDTDGPVKVTVNGDVLTTPEAVARRLMKLPS